MDEQINSYYEAQSENGVLPWQLEIDPQHTWLPHLGLVHQHTHDPFDYGPDYFRNYEQYRFSDIAFPLNLFRRSLTSEENILDIGVGDLAYLDIMDSSFPHDLHLGYDVNPVAISKLQKRNQWIDIFKEEIPSSITTVTLWDTLEHIPNPHEYFEIFDTRQLVISLPIFRELSNIKKSKHFKPNEHLYYFTSWGFIRWMEGYAYRLSQVLDTETQIGRSGILTFRFTRK